MKGFISRIYPNCSIQITNPKGLQILVSIQTAKKNPVPVEKVVQCEVKEGQRVDTNDTILTAYIEKEVVAIIVHVLWQPELLRKIESFDDEESIFAKVYYLNPYSKYNLKNHGKY